MEEKRRKKRPEKNVAVAVMYFSGSNSGSGHTSGYVPGRHGLWYKARALGACAALTLHGARLPARLLGTR